MKKIILFFFFFFISIFLFSCDRDNSNDNLEMKSVYGSYEVKFIMKENLMNPTFTIDDYENVENENYFINISENNIEYHLPNSDFSGNYTINKDSHPAVLALNLSNGKELFFERNKFLEHYRISVFKFSETSFNTLTTKK